MDGTLSNPKTIPHDYSCGLIFREFKVTMMHEHTCWLRCDRTFFGNENGGISRRNYNGINACLEHYLTWRWPEADQCARWNHHERWVKIFADDLFLCPSCGTFSLVDLGPDPLQTLGLEIQGESIEVWPSKTLVNDECAQQIRAFCQSRLETKEFYFKECDNEKPCGEHRKIAMRRLRRDYGWGEKKKRTETFQPLSEIKKEKKVEVLPWDEGHIYLIHMSGHYKIGIAKDTQKRISGIKTSSPFEIEILKSWRCKRPDLIEKIMHTRFGEHRVRGEWFRLPAAVLKYLLAVEDVRKEFAPDELEGDGE